MTNEEKEAGIGRLVLAYEDVRRKLGCAGHRLDAHQDAVDKLAAALIGPARNPGTLRERCAGVDWEGLRADADLLAELTDEMRRLGKHLMDAGLDRFARGSR